MAVMQRILAWLRAPVVTSMHVERYNWMEYSRDCPRGSGFCEDWGSYQLLVRERHWNGFLIGREILDRETIPQHVVIQMGTVGSWDWRSKWEGMEGVNFSWQPKRKGRPMWRPSFGPGGKP